jgi:integral membrane protein
MSQTPSEKHFQSVSAAIKFFKVTSYITGVALLLVMITWGLRRLIGLELWAFGPNGWLTLEPVVYIDEVATGLPASGVNMTVAILIVHGWLYVAYLFGDFRLWTLLRWNFLRFLVIAAGGVVPFLSFFTERHFSKVAQAQLDNREVQN